jgi:hypothetical protein
MEILGSTVSSVSSLTKDVKGMVLHVLSPDTTQSGQDLINNTPCWKTIVFVDNTTFPIEAKNANQLTYVRKAMRNGSDVLYLPFSIDYFTNRFQSGLENYNTKYIESKYSLVILTVDSGVNKYLDFFKERMPSGAGLLVRSHFAYDNTVWKLVDKTDAFLGLIKI